MTCDDFAEVVRELMPDWVKEIIKAQSPESDDDLDDLQSDLQKLLDEFRVPTVVLTPSRKLASIDTELDEEGISTPELRLIGDGERAKGSEPKVRDQAASKTKVRRAPEGSQASAVSKALERVPEIKILNDPEEVAGKSLTGRAGRYYKETQVLFINGMYPVVDRMAQELERELSGGGEPEAVRAIARTAAQRFMAFRVGKATCYAISKRLAGRS